MEARGLIDVVQNVPEKYVFVSRPNRSLGHRQMRWVFWGVALPCMGIASFFAGLGYWLMLPFAGLEMGLLAWAFERMRAHDADYESITIQGQQLIVESCNGGHTLRREWNTCWTRAECVCLQHERNCRFCVWSRGEAIELGRHLDDQGRIKLARTVRAKLANQ